MKKPDIQLLYVGAPFVDYMQKVHPDDRAMGTLTRVWDHPTPERAALLVLPGHSKDISVDLVLEEKEVQGTPTRVEFDPAYSPDGSAMWLRQDCDALVITNTEDAVAIAMRLMLWARLEQEKTRD